MSVEVALVPAIISAQCGNGAVRVQYSVHLFGEELDGVLGTGEVDLVGDEIADAVKDLSVLVQRKLEEMVGLVSEGGNPLGDEFPVDQYDDEEPL